VQLLEFSSTIFPLKVASRKMRSTSTARNTTQTLSSGEAADASLLTALGQNLRDLRARRGLTQRQVADAAGVSERFLAKLEAGSGNVSVVNLKRIADALQASIAELLAERSEESLEFALLAQLLRGMPAANLAELRARLLREHAGSDAGRLQRVALIGLRGAGKSALGARLAKKLGVQFVELDREIEREAGTSLHEIFLLYGQDGYRRYERRCLEHLLQREPSVVIATGGSIVSEAATYDLLLATCYTVWLQATPEEHMTRVMAQGDFRPMAGNREAMSDLRRILYAREPLYRRADAVVDTSGRSERECLAELQRVVEQKKD
jgi:XRE family aerobic/anaerobic benzoate catabolism transcriptional regulator